MNVQEHKRSGLTRTAPTAHDVKRHQEMIETVYAWMRRTRATQQTLVRCIQDFWRKRGDANYVCDHTLLSRILNPVEPHIPTPHRPKSMRILQAAMIICASTEDPNIITSAADEDQDWISDEEQAFKLHRARLRQLREHGRTDLFRALHRVGEFCAVARWMDDAASTNELDETFRQRACENTLLTLAALADSGDAHKSLYDMLVEQGVGAADAQRLVDIQTRRVRELYSATARPSVNMLAYAGAALFHCGQRDPGAVMLLKAVASCSTEKERHDPHWETLLELLERLLAADDSRAQEWSSEAAKIADEQRRAESGGFALLRQAWSCVNLPHVREHWTAAAPALVRELDGQPAAAEAPVRSSKANGTPRKRARAAAVAAATLALGLITSFWTFSPAVASPTPTQTMAAAPTPSQELILAIRGREASCPQPKPANPKPDPDQPTT